MTSLKHKKVTIRKPHTCFCCLREYSKGDEMYYSVVKDGSDFLTSYSCITCDDILSSYSDKISNDGIFYEACVRDACDEYNVITPEDLLVKLKACES